MEKLKIIKGNWLMFVTYVQTEKKIHPMSERLIGIQLRAPLKVPNTIEYDSGFHDSGFQRPSFVPPWCRQTLESRTAIRIRLITAVFPYERMSADHALCICLFGWGSLKNCPQLNAHNNALLTDVIDKKAKKKPQHIVSKFQTKFVLLIYSV